MNNQPKFFDVETGSLSDDQLALVKPEFRAAKNLKDPEKIKADIADKEADWRARAALDATTAQILAVGLLDGDVFTVLDGDEKTILTQFWSWADIELGLSNRLVGFCIFHFDLPMLARRSFVNGVAIPMSVRRSSYRPWHEGFVDIAVAWQCGNRDQTISLDLLARSLGVGKKTGSGADFAKLYQTDRAAALEYLHTDLLLAKSIYEKMNL
jgi:hypothetical protein